MRILMVCDFYAPFVGGVEQHVRHLAAGLSDRGHQVAVATSWAQGLERFERDGPVSVYRIPVTTGRLEGLFASGSRRWSPPWPDPEGMWCLRRIIASEHPHIIHGHDWLGRSCLPLKPGSGAKFVASLHYYTLSCAKKTLIYHGEPCTGPGFRKCLECASLHYGPGKGIPITLGNWVGEALERQTVDMFLPVSRATAAANGLVKGQVPFEVIPNFVPDEIDRSDQPIASYLAQLPAEPFLLYVGVLTHYKGVNVLLQSYTQLSNAPPLVLIAPTLEGVALDIPSYVTVLSSCPHAAVMEAWHRSMIAIAPSLWPEPCATVVLEAMVQGKPVIATNTGGMPDMIEDGVSGILVPPGDAHALRNAMELLISDARLRNAMGQSASKRVRAFQASAVIPRIERVYSRLMDSGAGAGTDLEEYSP